MSSPNSPKEVFGPYLVYERLGIGGMATVHRAKKRGIEGFERVSALKRLLPHLAQDGDFVKSFVREAKLAAMLQHANISHIYELGRVGHTYFMAMEYVDGYDVRKILRQARRAAGPPPIPVVLSIIGDLCDALDYAHARHDDATGEPLGIVHRDVSPSNLIVSHAGHLKVIDFGIAKATAEKLKTDTGRVKGKLGYMSPEAVRGDSLDARSDIFSAGIIAHELLTARPLFASKSDYETLTKIQRGDVQPPSVCNLDCPVELDDLILKALAKSPHERWPTAAIMRDALHRVALKYKLSATHSRTAEWLDWAFEQSGEIDSTGPVAAWRPPTAPAIPSGFDDGPPVAEADEEIVEIAWGGRDEHRDGPVVVPDVPDLSDQIPAPTNEPVPANLRARITYTTPAPTPTPRPGAGGLAVVGDDDVTNVAPMPLPPNREPPANWATGTNPPAPRRPAVGTAPPPAHTALPRTTAAEHLQRVGAQRIKPAGLTLPVPTSRARGLWYAAALGAVFGLVTATTAFFARPSAPAPAQTAVQTTAQMSDAPPPAPPAAPTRVIVQSSPSGLAVLLDDVPLDASTPATAEIAPGTHTIALSDRGVVLWKDKFVADASRDYTFHPALESSGAPIVLASAVEQRDGELPELDEPATIKAKLCIDRRGKVRDIQLQEAPRKHAKKIKKALGKWRYEPHRVDGERVSACFAVSLALDGPR
jgi:serine/threonine protein kinase